MSEERARPAITPHLWTGEEILWCDQPLAAGPVASAAARKGFYGALGGAAGALIVARYLLDVFRDVDSDTNAKLWLVSLGVGGAVLAFGTISAWSRARRLVHLVAYAVTNRRILMVQGDDVQWVGLRELESVHLSGTSVVLMRGRTETEELWANQENRRSAMKAESVARELTLASLPDPHQVFSLIQTLQQRTAS